MQAFAVITQDSTGSFYHFIVYANTIEEAILKTGLCEPSHRKE